MKYITSKDGTSIAYDERGKGPPLLLVHGTGIDHTYWEPVTAKLEQHFTIYSVDRRGRGQSGDTEPYTLQREFEDVVALIEYISGAVNLLGHSYGALCSLDAFERFDAYIKVGEYEKALIMLYEIARAPIQEMELQKAQSNWQARLAATPTTRREVIGAMNYHFSPDKFRNLKTPTLFLVGSETTPFYKLATETVHKALLGSRVGVLSGQGHEAVVTSPELFLREVISFFQPT